MLPLVYSPPSTASQPNFRFVEQDWQKWLDDKIYCQVCPPSPPPAPPLAYTDLCFPKSSNCGSMRREEEGGWTPHIVWHKHFDVTQKWHFLWQTSCCGCRHLVLRCVANMRRKCLNLCDKFVAAARKHCQSKKKLPVIAILVILSDWSDRTKKKHVIITDVWTHHDNRLNKYITDYRGVLTKIMWLLQLHRCIVILSILCLSCRRNKTETLNQPFFWSSSSSKG